MGTKEFAKAICERLGKKPEKLKVADFSKAPSASVKPYKYTSPRVQRDLVGADVSVCDPLHNPRKLGEALTQVANSTTLELKSISCRGVQVFPAKTDDIFSTDHLQCRFVSKNGKATHADVRALLEKMESAKMEWTRLEGLYNIDGQAGFSQ